MLCFILGVSITINLFFITAIVIYINVFRPKDDLDDKWLCDDNINIDNMYDIYKKNKEDLSCVKR